MFKERIILNRGNYKQYYQSTGILTGETLVGDSETIPGQGISPEEVMRRYVNGMSLPKIEGIFTDNPFVPDHLERMSQVDLIELSRSLRAVMASRTERLRARRAAPALAPADPVVPAPALAPQTP